MRKAGKFISYLLVFALITSLLSGLGYAANTFVDVEASTNNFTILEIVPSSNMASFGYFVKGQEPIIDGKTVAQNCLNASFRDYLKNAGCGEFNTSTSSFNSTDYFKTHVLGLNISDPLNITVVTKTPADSDLISAVNSADFIIINETVPSALRIGAQKTFSTAGCTFTTEQVLAIFKKIAGVEGQTPVPYIIDFNLMDRDSLADVRTSNAVFNAFSNKTGALFGYESADRLFNADQGIGVGQGFAQKFGTDSHLYLGSDSTSYKLYKLLSCIDPATLYGLYFKGSDGSYGIDQKLNQIVNGPDNKGEGSDGETSLYCLNTKLSAWSDLAFRPYYLTTSSRSVSGIMSTMGWFEAVTSSDASHTLKNKSVADFLQVIGGSDGRGITYKSGEGLFYASEAVKGSVGESIDLSSYTDIGSKVTINYSGSQWNGTTSIKNNTADNLTNWKVSFEVEGLNNYAYYSSSPQLNNPPIKSGNVVTIYSNSVSIGANGTFNLSGAMDPADSSKIKIITESSGSSDSKLGTIINSFRSLGSAKNDYHAYRILIISDNLPDSVANRTVIANLVKAANDAGKGLAGGILVDCVSKAQFNNISVNLNQSYDMICTIGSLASGSVGASKLTGYSGSKLTLNSGSDSSISSIVNEFKNNLLGKKFGVDFITLPAQYYTDFTAFFNGENGWGSYQGMGSTYVEGNKNYINDNDNSGKRELDFRFKVTGTSSYSIDLYVDVDGDFKFEDKEKVALIPNSSNNNYNSIPLSHENLFGEGGKDYVGGFSWKLVVSSGSDSISRIGYSAVRNETTDKNKIKILQIYPTDYKDQYDQEYYPHPMLLLPTADEIKRAQEKHGNISDYNISTINGTKGVNELKLYFKDIITADTATGYNSSSGKVSGVAADQKVPDSGKRSSIIYNSSFLYYFLDKLQDYEIDVTRYSVNSFNTAAGKDILLDAETGRLAKADGEQKKNLDGSDKYGYLPAQLGLTGDAWKTETVAWIDGNWNKYVVDSSSGLIYAIRGTEQGVITYLGSTYNSAAGTPIKGVNKENEFDLLMIGFGDTLDYMEGKAVSLLRDYLSAGGPAFVGNGAVSRSSVNTFGNDPVIRNLIGISTTATNGYNYQANAVHPLITTNDTLFSHYPYTVNHVMKATGDGKQPYRLTLTGDSDDPIVAFAKYVCNDGSYGTWADAAENYYVYKKNSIVFCGFGNTFHDAQMKQQGAVLPMAETLMIVNALVASSRFGSSGATTDPYFDCIDDDSSVLDVTGLEDDYTETNSAGDDVWFFKDSIYTDYDAYDIAKFYQDSAQTKFNTPMQSSGIKLPSSISGAEANVRWIPYQATLPTEDGGYIEFRSPSKQVLNLQVYSVKENKWLEPSGGRYKVSRNGIYYIGIPLNAENARYNGITAPKPGFIISKDGGDNVDMFAVWLNLYASDNSKVLERHVMTMIRRVIYHVK